MDKKTEENQNYTEQYNGIIMLRKGQLKDYDVWYATVGKQLVSDGTFGTKEELIDNLNNITLNRICRIVAGAFGRAIEYKEGKK